MPSLLSQSHRADSMIKIKGDISALERLLSDPNANLLAGDALQVPTKLLKALFCTLNGPGKVARIEVLPAVRADVGILAFSALATRRGV